MDVLLVEDDPVSRKLLERRLNQRGHRVDAVGSAEAALERLDAKRYPMLFLDIGLPGMSGLELNRRVRAADGDPPTYVLVGTGETGEKRLNAILDAGADDYVAKPYQRTILDTRLAVAEKSVESLRERSRLQRELTFMAAHDPLTGLLNRRQLDSVLAEAAEASKPTVVMQMDLDHFKQINDTFGHLEGDRHLKEIADLLRSKLPENAWIVRFGGDEFVAVIPGLSVREASSVATSLIETIREIRIQHGSLAVRSGASIGIARLRPELSPKEMLKEADTACYRAKSMGKNCAQVYVPFDTKLFLGSVGDTDGPGSKQDGSAMDDDHLELWFQPVCDLARGRVHFHEALLRFIPAKGRPAVDAAMFMAEINSAEKAPLLDRFVVRRICRHLADDPDLVASVNVNAASICNWEFARYVEAQLETHGVDGARLILEITETHDIPDLPLARSVIEQFASMGIRTALDDLGAGFTSIAVLKHLPIRLVKVDGALIRDLSNDLFNRAFIEALGRLAQGLDFETVAERIETVDEWAEAKRLGLSFGQGHLIGPARPQPYGPADIQIPDAVPD